MPDDKPQSTPAPAPPAPAPPAPAPVVRLPPPSPPPSPLDVERYTKGDWEIQLHKK